MSAPLQALTVPPEVEGSGDADRTAARHLLGDIAQHIASARAMLRELADTDAVHGVGELLAVAGWLADFGAKLAGEPGHAGDPAEWFLKPTTRAAVAALGTGSTP